MILDKVLVPSIPVRAQVGCTEEERRVQQTILIDIELRCSLVKAAMSDSIENAVDYVLVRNEVEAVSTARPYALVETLAERISARLLEVFHVEEVLVRVRKPSALESFGVPWAGVEIVRSQDG